MIENISLYILLECSVGLLGYRGQRVAILGVAAATAAQRGALRPTARGS